MMFFKNTNLNHSPKASPNALLNRLVGCPISLSYWR